MQALDVDAKPHFDHEDYGHHIMRNAWAPHLSRSFLLLRSVHRRTLAAAAFMTAIKTTALR